MACYVIKFLVEVKGFLWSASSCFLLVGFVFQRLVLLSVHATAVAAAI